MSVFLLSAVLGPFSGLSCATADSCLVIFVWPLSLVPSELWQIVPPQISGQMFLCHSPGHALKHVPVTGSTMA